MARNYFDWLQHGLFRRPYSLHTSIDRAYGDQYTVVLLHGIGSSGVVWNDVAEQLVGEQCRVISFDLLGFGMSTKPDINYTADDHARAVIKTMRKHRVRKPIVLVGHSMGALVAVRIARLRPDLVKHLVLYQMPVYEGLPKRRDYGVRRDIYYRIYNSIVNDPAMLLGSSMRAKVLRKAGVVVTKETLRAFARSLQHTVMEQTALSDLSHLNIPIDIIYGSLDILVIRGRPKDVFSEVLAPLQTHTIARLHRMSSRASNFIAKRVRAAARELLVPK